MKHRSKEISYTAMRVSLLAFLLLLAFAAAVLWLYPYICLQIGTRAAERGDTEKAADMAAFFYAKKLEQRTPRGINRTAFLLLFT